MFEPQLLLRGQPGVRSSSSLRLRSSRTRLGEGRPGGVPSGAALPGLGDRTKGHARTTIAVTLIVWAQQAKVTCQRQQRTESTLHDDGQVFHLPDHGRASR